MKYIAFLVSLVCLVTSSLVNAEEVTNRNEPIKYNLRITDASHHLAEVTLLVPHTDSASIDFVLPAWRLGRYEILDLAKGIRHFKVLDSKGDELPVSKVDKNTWRATLAKPSKLVVSYQLYANQLEKRTRHIDDTHAYLDAVATFVYSPMYIDNPVTVDLDVPNGWRSRSGMASTGEHGFKADNYYILSTSPIETGIHEYREFSVDGKDYELVVWGKGNYNIDKIIADYTQMIPVFGEIYGRYPFDRYLFIVHSAPGLRGATEHHNSTIIQRDSMSFAKKKDYQRFISTSSHEFVHTWNVKAYRPEGIAEYDYTKENYSDLLWITEGSTSYFADLFLVRAGVLSAKDYLDDLAAKIHSHLNKPGRKVMTAKESSFDTWILEGGHRAHNDSVNIYSEGRLLSLLMDVEILTKTDAKADYALLHRYLFERFPAPEKAFTASDIKSLMTELTGENYDSFWQEYMEGTKAIDFSEMLAAVGLEYTEKAPSKDAIAAFNTGLRFASGAEPKIAVVSRDSAAWQAGLTANDTLVAINDLKVTKDNFAELLSAFEAGDEVKVSYFRRGLLKETSMSLVPQQASATISYMANATELQKRLYQKWLGQAYPENVASSD